MVNNNGLRIDPWGSFVYLFLLCSILLEWAHIATWSPNHSFWSVKYSFPVGATSIWSCAPKHFGSAPKNLHLLTQVLPKPKINFEPWVHQWSIALKHIAESCQLQPATTSQVVGRIWEPGLSFLRAVWHYMYVLCVMHLCKGMLYKCKTDCNNYYNCTENAGCLLKYALYLKDKFFF